MHFWIDKRSQTCVFGGRHRIPSSLSAGSSRSQARSVANTGIWGGAGTYIRTPVQAKPMVTPPVHRFQSIESVAATPSNSRLPRRSHRHHHSDNHHHPRTSHHHHAQPSSGPTVSATQSQGEFERVYLDVPNILPVHEPQLSNSMKLKCNAMWISFATLTLFAGGVRLYLSNQVLVFAMVLVMALVITCYVGVCRTGHSWEVFEAMVQPNQAVVQGAAPPVTVEPPPRPHNVVIENIAPRITQEEIMLTSVFSLQTTNPTVPQPPPPPYHIAILLPHQQPPENIDESPPPSYDKILR